MAQSGSFASSHPPAARLTSVVSHLSSPRYKVVVCRNLGPDVMPLLENRHELDVCLCTIFDLVVNMLVASWLSGRRTAHAIENGSWTISRARPG